jgi:general secretion pathway protein B
MSLILDALNRADHERKNQDAVPGLNTVHASPVLVLDEKPDNKRGLYFAITVSVVALVACIVWFVAKPGKENANKVAQPTADAQSVVPSNHTTASAAAIQSVDSAKPGLIDKESSPSMLNDPKAAESVIANKPTPVVEQLYTAPETQSSPADPKINELYAAEEPSESESIVDPFAAQTGYASPPTHITDVNAGRIAPEIKPTRTFASITNVQDFNELPWNTKQQIPTISYQRHNFLAGGISSVVINGQTLGEGNIATSSQLIVQEIFEDGVVLKRGNVVFKLRALNGWINM